VGVGAVVIDGGKVLLVRRGQDPLKGEWSLPGGALELGETLQQAVIREVWEETGLTVVPAGIVEILDRITRDEATGQIRYHYVLIDFICRVAGGTLNGASDVEDACWAPRDELPDYQLASVTLNVIEKALRLNRSQG
jgi:8-oxo-dGTP diphosphatase